MNRSLPIRTFSLVLALALSLAFMQPKLASAAASITLSPSSGPAGTVVTVSGSGFTPGESLSIYFNMAVIGTTTATNTGSIPANTTFTVPSITTGAYNVTVAGATVAPIATFTVTAGTPPITATKSVRVSGIGDYSATASAVPNNTLTYRITVTNNTGTALNTVTVNDYIQPGQGLILSGFTGTPSFTCTYNQTTRYLSCSTATLAAGATATLTFSTVVGNTNPTISNTATVTTANGPTATTNPTLVSVSLPPVVTTGQLLLCGPKLAYLAPSGASAGSVNISGVVVPIAAGAVISAGTNTMLTSVAMVCATFTLSSGVATAVSAGLSNLGSVGMVCGVFQPVSPTSMTVGGFPIAVAYNAIFLVGLVPGASYCFLLNQSGVAFAVLSGIPTAVSAPKKGFVPKDGFFRPQ